MNIPQLDTMRFFAFLSVFFFHTLPLCDVASRSGVRKILAMVAMVFRTSGRNGVGLFFVLSAYLITELLRRERNLTGAIDLRLFYIRRALRIWPLYYLAVGLGLLWQVISPAEHMSSREILTYLFFLKNWDIAFFGWNWNPIYILWTVSCEEQFYLVWPVAQKYLSDKRMLSLCIASLVAIPLVALLPHSIFTRPAVADTWLYFVFFPVGGILSFAVQDKQNGLKASSCIAMIAAGVGLWFAGQWLVFPFELSSVPQGLLVGSKLIILAGTVLIFLAFLKSPIKWSPKPLTYLGKISYGLYVYHVLIFMLMVKLMAAVGFVGMMQTATRSITQLAVGICIQLPLALGATIAVASFSYEFFEKRFLKLKERFAIVPSRLS